MKIIRVTILLATALCLSQLACSSGNQANAPANTSVQNSAPVPIAPATANNAAPNTGAANTGSPQAPANTANANTKDNPFTELVMLYSQLFTARMKGDKAKAEGLMADDYKETTEGGKVVNKAQVLADVSPDKKYDSYSLDDLKSTTNGDTGTVTGRVSVITNGKTESWQFTDTFKKQQGRWLAVSSQRTNYKKS
jgi:hypothetical protein